MISGTSDATFKTDVLDSKMPVLVDFWAPWCDPCKTIGPIIDNIGYNAEGTVKTFKLNVDKDPITADKYRITAIPTVIIFQQGKVHKQFVGVQSEKVYEEALKIKK